MKKPFLIAETPRAGQLNYRFIVPRGTDINTRDLERYFGTARGRAESVGHGYIAVSRAVYQEGGREGNETLVLANVDTQALPAPDCAWIVDKLNERISELGNLVTESIDWAKEGGTATVECEKLNEWSKDFRDLPSIKRSKWRGWGKMAIILVAVALVGGVGVQYWPSGWLEQLNEIWTGHSPPASRRPV